MKSHFKIQYISDIHLEFRKKYDIIPVAENLALCGDIGYPDQYSYHNFINDCSEKFKNVFVIYGNHEYYNIKDSNNILTMDEKKSYTKNFNSNVYFLDNDVVYINKYTNKVQKNCDVNCIKIIGSTLWSNISLNSNYRMNDTYLIYKSKNERLTDVDIRNLHKESVEYILEELDKDKKIPCVLLTHHGPHVSCFGQNRSLQLLSAYVNHIPKLYKKKNLIACISGHTHSSSSNKISGIQFLSNQLGYPYEKPYLTLFKNDKILEIEIH